MLTVESPQKIQIRCRETPKIPRPRRITHFPSKSEDRREEDHVALATWGCSRASPLLRSTLSTFKRNYKNPSCRPETPSKEGKGSEKWAANLFIIEKKQPLKERSRRTKQALSQITERRKMSRRRTPLNCRRWIQSLPLLKQPWEEKRERRDAPTKKRTRRRGGYEYAEVAGGNRNLLCLKWCRWNERERRLWHGSEWASGPGENAGQEDAQSGKGRTWFTAEPEWCWI